MTERKQSGQGFWDWLVRPHDRDFTLNGIGLVVIMVFALAGSLGAYGLDPETIPRLLAFPVMAVMLYGILLGALGRWWTCALLGFITLSFLALKFPGQSAMPLVAGSLLLGLIAGPMVQVVRHWERAVVLRLGKFKEVKGPGLFLLVPFVDRSPQPVDMRIRVSDFPEENTLTKDSVPVCVDALTFWMVWSAEKAVLEVADFEQAVVMSAQTALQDAISKHDLDTLLCRREELGKETQAALERKTMDWGITLQSIEIHDIKIPKDLEDAMSRKAQAEREKESRLILGSAEVELADQFEQASRKYAGNETALHLRGMTIVLEGLKAGGSLVVLPSTAVDTMTLGKIEGLKKLADPGATSG